MRAQPKPRIGVAVLVACLAAFYGAWIATGIDDAHIGDAESTLLNRQVAPLAAGAVVLVLASSFLGWWRPALVAKRRIPRWMILAPALALVTAIGMPFLEDFSSVTTVMWVYLVLGSLGVGLVLVRSELRAKKGEPVEQHA